MWNWCSHFSSLQRAQSNITDAFGINESKSHHHATLSEQNKHIKCNQWEKFCLFCYLCCHQYTHTKGQLLFKSTLCAKIFVLLQILLHISTIHTCTDVCSHFKCSQCDKFFITKQAEKQQLLRVHDPDTKRTIHMWLVWKPFGICSIQKKNNMKLCSLLNCLKYSIYWIRNNFSRTAGTKQHLQS